MVDYFHSWAVGIEARGTKYWPREIERRRGIVNALRAWSPSPALGVPPEVITEPFTVMLGGVTSDSGRQWLGGSGASDGTLSDARRRGAGWRRSIGSRGTGVFVCFLRLVRMDGRHRPRRSRRVARVRTLTSSVTHRCYDTAYDSRTRRWQPPRPARRPVMAPITRTRLAVLDCHHGDFGLAPSPPIRRPVSDHGYRTRCTSPTGLNRVDGQRPAEAGHACARSPGVLTRPRMPPTPLEGGRSGGGAGAPRRGEPAPARWRTRPPPGSGKRWAYYRTDPAARLVATGASIQRTGGRPETTARRSGSDDYGVGSG